jgi:hydrogenase expression/formation protein HypC
MCLGIPAQIMKREGRLAEVQMGGIVRKASLQLLPEAEEGDWVIIHAGFAIQQLDEEEALETLKLFEAMERAYQESLRESPREEFRTDLGEGEVP